MGMFDSYKSVPDLHCPTCESVLNDWQGKDANCGLFVWQQGISFPVAQEAFSWNIDEEERIKLRLPENFEIYTVYTDCEKCGDLWITATCKTENGTWSESKITKVEKLPRLPRKWFDYEKE